MPVPEAAMNEDHPFPQAEHEVRVSWQFFPVKSVAVTKSVNKAPDHHLGLGVLVPDPAHSLATLAWRQRIHAPVPAAHWHSLKNSSGIVANETRIRKESNGRLKFFRWKSRCQNWFWPKTSSDTDCPLRE